MELLDESSLLVAEARPAALRILARNGWQESLDLAAGEVFDIVDDDWRKGYCFAVLPCRVDIIDNNGDAFDDDGFATEEFFSAVLRVIGKKRLKTLSHEPSLEEVSPIDKSACRITLCPRLSYQEIRAEMEQTSP